LQAVRGISDLITIHGLINLDFADVRTIMGEMGLAIMGAGSASGENRAVEAAQRAISSPLLEDLAIRGAKGILINITGSHDLSLHEVDEAATLIKQEAHDDANIIFGAVIDERMGDEIRITVIATGFGDTAREAKKPSFNVSREPPVFRPTPSRTIPRDRDPARPVVRMGTITDDLESPTWERPKPFEAEEDNGRHEPADEYTIAEEGEDRFEIPAFLRKNAG